MPNFSTTTLEGIVSLMLKNIPLIHKRNEGYVTLSKSSMRFTELWNKNGYMCLQGSNGLRNQNTQPVTGTGTRTTLRTLVLLHGYGLGHGFYFQNFEHLLHGSVDANSAGAVPAYDRIVALDWPGFGHSEREVKFPTRSFYHDLFLSREKSDQHTKSSIDFFIDSLHEWRTIDESNLQKASMENSKENDSKAEPLKFEYVIAGHSLGGYLVGNYALKHPDALSGLILISPIGLQAHPEHEISFSGNFIKLWRTFGFLGAFGLFLIRLLYTFNWTPQSIARTLIFFRMKDYVYSHVRNYVSRRFPNNTWTEAEIDVIADYLFDIWTSGVTRGELSLNSLLVPKLSINPNFEAEFANFIALNPPTASADSDSGGYKAVSTTDDKKEVASTSTNTNTSDNSSASSAKEKKVFNNGKVQTREQANKTRPPRPINIGMHSRITLHGSMSNMPCPVLLMYGDNDWLNYKGVDEDYKKWQSLSKNPFHFELIKDAGHYLYIDNSDMFNESVISWTNKVIGGLK